MHSSSETWSGINEWRCGSFPSFKINFAILVLMFSVINVRMVKWFWFQNIQLVLQRLRVFLLQTVSDQGVIDFFRLFRVIHLAEKRFKNFLVGWLVQVFSLLLVFIKLASLVQHCERDEEVIRILWGLLRWEDIAGGGDHQEGEEGEGEAEHVSVTWRSHWATMNEGSAGRGCI